MRRRLCIPMIVAAVGTTTMFASCAGEGPPPSRDEQLDAATAALTLEGLCAAGDAAADRERARAIFFDESHDRLHVLAAELSDKDRSAAATLLESKQVAEESLQTEQGAKLAQAIRGLDAATREGMRALELPTPACHGEPGPTGGEGL